MLLPAGDEKTQSQMSSAAHLTNESPMMRHCPCGSCNTTERVHQAQATVGATSDILISAAATATAEACARSEHGRHV